MERETGVRFYPYAETCTKTVSNVSRLLDRAWKKIGAVDGHVWDGC